MPEQTVLIIGGGIAGLTAANQLAAMKISTILVEKQGAVGGHAARYTCKATDACVKCGACLVVQACRRVLADPAVEVVTDSRITAVERSGGRFRFSIAKEPAAPGEDLTREADAVILACGFKAFDPHAKPYGYGRFPNVVTNLELEWMLREKNVPVRPSDQRPPDRMAFVQCVGSRDRQLGHLWCSKVCCASALRMARLIKARCPEVDITFFYIDIQTFGKDFESVLARVKEDFTLVRTLPGDVFSAEDGRLRLTYFDPAQRQGNEDLFDLLVLSVGITPDAQNLQLARLFQLEPEPTGFWPIATGSGVFCAGTACGPMSIAESIVSGKQAALQAAGHVHNTAGAEGKTPVSAVRPTQDGV
jgi:heterodisulfide reductase subunit A